MNQRRAIPASGGELKWYTYSIGSLPHRGTFFDELCLIMTGFDMKLRTATNSFL